MSPTLEEMTPVEQDLCIGRWCELLGASYLVILTSRDEPYNGHATVMVPGMAKTTYTLKDALTPRFDLPRAWTPSGEPVPGEWEESLSSEHHHRWCARWEKKPDEVPKNERKWAVLGLDAGREWFVAHPGDVFRGSDGLLECWDVHSRHGTWKEAMQEVDHMVRAHSRKEAN